MNFNHETDALELHPDPESMEENNSIRENITPNQMMEREVNTRSQSQMTINVQRTYNNNKWLHKCLLCKCKDRCQCNSLDNRISRTTCKHHQWS